MTDITELAQRMKAAAVRAKAATEDYVAHRMSITVCLEECKEFNDLSDGPDNILALVEELEKALVRIAELEESNAQVIQSRDHYKRITEEGLKQLAESRTVTVKLPADNAAESESPENDVSAWFDEGWNARGKADKEALTAAGIKWEGE